MPLQSVSFTKPGMSQEQRQFDRQRQIAMALQQQAFQPEQTQMAGGYAVPTGILGPVAKIAQAWAAKSIGERADKGEQDYIRQTGEDRSRLLAEAMRAGQGMPAQNPQSAADALPGEPQAVPAVAPDPRRTYEMLVGSQYPELQQFGMGGMLDAMKPKDPVRMRPGESLVDPATNQVRFTALQQPKLERVEIPDGKGGKRVGFVNMNDLNPLSTFVEAGVDPAQMQLGPAGQVYNPRTIQPGQVFNNPNDLMQIGPDGATVVNRPLVGARQEIAAAGAARNTNVTNVNTKPDNAYFTERRKDQANQFAELEKAAQSAVNQVAALDRFIKANETGTAGGAQPLVSSVQNFLSTFGYEPKSLQDVRVMEQVIGDILGNKMAELGARGLTDKDMQILREALPRVNIDRESRKNVAEIIRRASIATIDNYRAARDEEARIYPEFSRNNPVPLWFKNAPTAAQAGGPRIMPSAAEIEAEIARRRGGQ